MYYAAIEIDTVSSKKGIDNREQPLPPGLRQSTQRRESLLRLSPTPRARSGPCGRGQCSSLKSREVAMMLPWRDLLKICPMELAGNNAL